jgi:hypothetical protein
MSRVRLARGPHAQPFRQSAGFAVCCHEGVLGCCGCCRSTVDGDEVLDGERCSSDVRESQVNRDDIVEAQWCEIAHTALEYGCIESGFTIRRIGMTDRSEVLDSRYLQIVQIVAVVDDAHGIGLDEAHPDVVTEGVGSRIEWRMESGNRVVHSFDRSCQMV